ncbi:hypothetical protein CYMTET_34888 [Cymbomonas tetramitiformis]|uniref:E3 ubiquitin-protein ligase n=1 Tax=Cymbomonas tetramitiformis TaxID=36881 RepID=A0AAE0FA61_9CHLO|nr:hypothetical protein CYMTET_34888 [Cymbomonas tetramitiformis]
MSAENDSASQLEPQLLKVPWLLEWAAWLLFGGSLSYGYEQLEKHSTGGGTCGALWGGKEYAYRCRTCEMDPTCAICMQCFINGDHEGHDYAVIHVAGGCCDCGDPTAWKEEGFCKMHGSSASQSRLPAAVEQIAPLVLRALCGFWCTSLVRVEAAEETLAVTQSCSRCTLRFADWLRGLCERNTAMLSLVAQCVADPELQLLRSLLFCDHLMASHARQALHALIFKLLGDADFKEALACAIIRDYRALHELEMESESQELATTDQSHGLMSVLNVQIFTVPALTPALVRHHQLVDTLLAYLQEILSACRVKDSSGMEHLDCENPTISSRGYGRPCDDLLYALTPEGAAQYVVQERQDLLSQWMELVSLLQGMHKQVRLTDAHSEVDSEVWTYCYSLENRICAIMPLILKHAAPASDSNVEMAGVGAGELYLERATRKDEPAAALGWLLEQACGTLAKNLEQQQHVAEVAHGSPAARGSASCFGCCAGAPGSPAELLQIPGLALVGQQDKSLVPVGLPLDETKEGISFHIPLHRLVAGILQVGALPTKPLCTGSLQASCRAPDPWPAHKGQHPGQQLPTPGLLRSVQGPH